MASDIVERDERYRRLVRQLSVSVPNQIEAMERLAVLMLAVKLTQLMVGYFHGPPALGKTTAAYAAALLLNCSSPQQLSRRDLRNPREALKRTDAMPSERTNGGFLLLAVNDLCATSAQATKYIQRRFKKISAMPKARRPNVLLIYFDEAHMGNARFWRPLMRLFTDGEIADESGGTIRLPDGVPLLILSAGNPVSPKLSIRAAAAAAANNYNDDDDDVDAMQAGEALRRERAVYQEVARGFPVPEVCGRIVRHPCIFRQYTSDQLDFIIPRCLVQICEEVGARLDLQPAITNKLALHESVVTRARSRLYVHSQNLRAMRSTMEADIAAVITKKVDKWPMIELKADEAGNVTVHRIEMDESRLFRDEDQEEDAADDDDDAAADDDDDATEQDATLDEKELSRAAAVKLEMEHQALVEQCSPLEQYLLHLDTAWRVSDVYLNAVDLDQLDRRHPCVIVPDPSVVLLAMRWWRGMSTLPLDQLHDGMAFLDMLASWCGTLKMHARAIGAGVFRLLVRADTQYESHLTFALRNAGIDELSEIDLATSRHPYPLDIDRMQYTGRGLAHAHLMSLHRWRAIMLRSDVIRTSASDILARLSEEDKSQRPTSDDYANELKPWCKDGGLGERSYGFFALDPRLLSLGDEAIEFPSVDLPSSPSSPSSSSESMHDDRDEGNERVVEANAMDDELPNHINGVPVVHHMMNGRIAAYIPASKDVLAAAFGWTGSDVESGHSHVMNALRHERGDEFGLQRGVIDGDARCPWQNEARELLYTGLCATSGKLARFLPVAELEACVKAWESHHK